MSAQTAAGNNVASWSPPLAGMLQQLTQALAAHTADVASEGLTLIVGTPRCTWIANPRVLLRDTHVYSSGTGLPTERAEADAPLSVTLFPELGPQTGVSNQQLAAEAQRLAGPPPPNICGVQLEVDCLMLTSAGKTVCKGTAAAFHIYWDRVPPQDLEAVLPLLPPELQQEALAILEEHPCPKPRRPRRSRRPRTTWSPRAT